MHKRPPRRVAVLGSTGSIGRQALEVIRQHPDAFEVVALAAGRDETALAQQAQGSGSPRTGLGAGAAAELATGDDVDVVLNAIVGAAGLEASVAALSAGKILALANKESLVAGSEVLLAAASEGGGAIAPVDSEHAALAQCLAGVDAASVRRIVLTASGGPFLRRDDLGDVKPKDALDHPTWSMGPKITVDSATMMNKGLEVIEAHHLFGFDYDDIGVVVHPQSVVHAIVELVDGSALLQAATADMRIPILAALSHPDRIASDLPPIDLARAGTLQFEDLDTERFPAVELGYRAGRAGLTYPAALNAANEVAVGRFLAGDLPFLAISDVIAEVLDDHEGVPATDLEAVLEVDRWARRRAESAAGRHAPARAGETP